MSSNCQDFALAPSLLIETFGRCSTASVGAHVSTADDEETRRLLREKLRPISRNRRMTFLRTRGESDEYFTVESMRLRAPKLYESLVGPDDVNAPFADGTPLTERIFASFIVSEAEEARRIAQEEKLGEEDEHEDDEDDADEGNAELAASGLKRRRVEREVAISKPPNSNGISAMLPPPARLRTPWVPPGISLNTATVEVDDDDEDNDADVDEGARRQVRLTRIQRFKETMKERWLFGLESDFDYEKIDNNEQFDDLAQIERDAQEKYFDED